MNRVRNPLFNNRTPPRNVVAQTRNPSRLSDNVADDNSDVDSIESLDEGDGEFAERDGGYGDESSHDADSYNSYGSSNSSQSISPMHSNATGSVRSVSSLGSHTDQIRKGHNRRGVLTTIDENSDDDDDDDDDDDGGSEEGSSSEGSSEGSSQSSSGSSSGGSSEVADVLFTSPPDLR